MKDPISALEYDAEVFVPSEDENARLRTLDERYKSVSLMSQKEREFLHALILRNKPKKLLELGVYAGSSSVVMLNAIKDDPGAVLHCVDYAETLPLEENKPVGFAVDYYPELSKKRKLFIGALSLKFMDEIGDGIDFCLIDTMHTLPGEILDTLMVLPYLSENAIIVYHDVNYHTFGKNNRWVRFYENCVVNNLLMSAVHGKKYIQGDFSRGDNYGGDMTVTPYFPNIGAVKINSETKKHVFELFNVLTLKWAYWPKICEDDEIAAFLSRHYDKRLIDYLREVFIYQREYIRDIDPTFRQIIRLLVIKIFGKNLVQLIYTIPFWLRKKAKKRKNRL
jgi:predicted O-methyltransferase YrrM